MKRAIIEDKSINFAIRIVKLYDYIRENKHEYIMSKQLMRCGTSIGANVSEAQMGQTKADFYAKIAIALKSLRSILLDAPFTRHRVFVRQRIFQLRIRCQRITLDFDINQ